jgi:acyl-CoA synthetase (AMP-forming)/AMP-acid ligase II
MPLVSGVHSIMMHPLDWVVSPGMFIQAASKYQATLSWNPNFAYSFMAQRVRLEQTEGVDLSSLRGLVNCSECVTLESQHRFLDRFVPLGLKPNVFWGCYAMAETTFALTHGETSDLAYLDSLGPTNASVSLKPPLVSVGRPLEGVELVVKDDQSVTLPERHLGEIWARSPFNFSGYYGNPSATEAAFHDGWYKTGDLGYRVGDEYFICSRKKDLLILSGINVFPQDVEEAVAAVEGVSAGRVAAFAHFDPQFQTERLFVLGESQLPEEGHGELIVRIRQRLLATFQIANFEVRLVPPGWLVKSSAGKMSRRANQAKWSATQVPPPNAAPDAS